MAYSTISKSSLYFNTKLYSGTGSAQNITGVGFQPDFTWIKDRTNANSHMLVDAVRGATKVLASDANYAETTDANRVSAFTADGFNVGTNNNVNQSGANVCSWNWKAGGAGSANTDGSQNTTVSVNTTAGFSIVKWTGADSTASLGHGLGVVPKMIIAKRLATRAWTVYHVGVGANKKLVLNTNAAEASAADFDDTPTSSVINVGYTDDINGSGADYIAYCFAEKKGFSKFGKYRGNGNTDGMFAYTGFKPAFILAKIQGHTNNWYMFDSTRNTFNPTTQKLRADTSAAEATGTDKLIDILSNGFKMRSSDAEFNQVGNEYIYMAFAEEPLVANVGESIPATAR
tara:strand:+ start:872 stop:1903 length:1032 start_codon:yes stop_codon:yes gene_type:complete